MTILPRSQGPSPAAARRSWLYFFALPSDFSNMAPVNLMFASRGGEDLTAGEYQMKAAFLTHFAQFVEWPSAAPAEATIAIAMVGDDPFGGALEDVIGAGRSNYAFVVRRLQWNDSLAGCRSRTSRSSSRMPAQRACSRSRRSMVSRSGAG